MFLTSKLLKVSNLTRRLRTKMMRMFLKITPLSKMLMSKSNQSKTRMNQKRRKILSKRTILLEKPRHLTRKRMENLKLRISIMFLMKASKKSSNLSMSRSKSIKLAQRSLQKKSKRFKRRLWR